jgi:hypothetical protein
MGEVRNAYIFWLKNPERKIQVGRPRHRWEGNILEQILGK